MSSSKAVKPKGSATASSSRNLTPVLNSPSLNLDEPDENDDDSEDNDAWDEVDVVNDQAAAGIDIVLSKTNGSSKTKSKQAKKKAAVSTPFQRMLRQESHKLHTSCLLASAMIRNRWLNDQELHARLLSHIPSQLQDAFHSITKANHPNERDRTRLFDDATKELVQWWGERFKVFEGRGISRPTGIRLIEDLIDDTIVVHSELNPPTAKAKGKGKEGPTILMRSQDLARIAAVESAEAALESKSGEWIKSVKSMRKHAQMMSGSRDMSAQLFTATCRALDVPARLVSSLQPIDWKSPAAPPPKKKKSAAKGKTAAGKAKKKVGAQVVGSGKGKGKAKAVSSSSESESEEEEDELEEGEKDEAMEVDSPAAYSSKPIINLRKTKPAKRKDDALDPEDAARPPIFWTEVYSRSHREWITVDPLRKKMRCRGIMEPTRNLGSNKMLYVVALEDDGICKDVTMRYAKKFVSSTSKARVPSRKGTDWFGSYLSIFGRKYVLNRDLEEDNELRGLQSNESMPVSIAAFKDHPNYVLERHIKRDEAILPDREKVSDFTGTKGTGPLEPIYLRADIVTVKSKENYMKVGRRIQQNVIPYKFVKSRAVTIRRKRAEAAAEEEGIEREGQAMYGEDQTELWIADPIVDNKIPRNDFGNIDLYVPHMLPAGGVHITSKYAAKCAKTLEIPYAEAVTGFEFKNRGSYPIITGIVIPVEFEEIILAAVEERTEAEETKAFTKFQERAITKWKKLIIGLRIRQRLNADFMREGEKTGVVPQGEISQFGLDAQIPMVATASGLKIKIKPKSTTKTNGNGNTTASTSKKTLTTNGVASGSGTKTKTTKRKVEMIEISDSD